MATAGSFRLNRSPLSLPVRLLAREVGVQRPSPQFRIGRVLADCWSLRFGAAVGACALLPFGVLVWHGTLSQERIERYNTGFEWRMYAITSERMSGVVHEEMFVRIDNVWRLDGGMQVPRGPAITLQEAARGTCCRYDIARAAGSKDNFSIVRKETGVIVPFLCAAYSYIPYEGMSTLAGWNVARYPYPLLVLPSISSAPAALVNLAIVVAVLFVLRLAAAELPAITRLKRGLCPVCRYRMREDAQHGGFEFLRCPECGWSDRDAQASAS